MPVGFAETSYRKPRNNRNDPQTEILARIWQKRAKFWLYTAGFAETSYSEPQNNRNAPTNWNISQNLTKNGQILAICPWGLRRRHTANPIIIGMITQTEILAIIWPKMAKLWLYAVGFAAPSYSKPQNNRNEPTKWNIRQNLTKNGQILAICIGVYGDVIPQTP